MTTLAPSQHPETGDEIDPGPLHCDGPNAVVTSGLGSMITPEIRDWLLVIEAADGSTCVN